MADPQALTAKLLEVLPVCPEELKRDAISFLPEVATEDDHEVGAGRCWRCASGGEGGGAGLLQVALPRPRPLPAHTPLLLLSPLAGWTQEVVRVLEGMMGESAEFILPSIEALANLCLTPSQQVGAAGGCGGCPRRNASQCLACGHLPVLECKSTCPAHPPARPCRAAWWRW